MTPSKTPIKKQKVIVATGGGFDPIHKGHIRLLKRKPKKWACSGGNVEQRPSINQKER